MARLDSTTIYGSLKVNGLTNLNGIINLPKLTGSQIVNTPLLSGDAITTYINPNLIPPATQTTRGGIRADTKQATDTVEVKIDVASEKLYAPTYPTVPTVTNDLTDALKSNYDDAYTHSGQPHAPSNAQKNSDITKAEIEAKLTGAITTHTHAYEPSFTKNTGFNKAFGTTVGTVAQGNDSRFSDARTPLAHTHVKADITDFPTSMPASDVSAWAKASSKPSYALGDISNVTLSSPSNGQVLKYDGSAWVNSSDSNTDTKNTAGATNTSSKIFLVGATSQAANPQTYSDDEVFATNGVLNAKSFISTVATGTAPFAVSSTTPVANLQAATATKLHTARTINGISFDGSANITITAEGTTNLSVGTVTATNVPILSSNGIDITTLPAATNLLAGIVINGTQTFGGEKTFAESIKVGTGTKVWETVPSASTIAWKDSSDTVRMSLSNAGILDVAIKDQNDASAIKFWTGTQEQYDAIGSPSADVVYFITE